MVSAEDLAWSWKRLSSRIPGLNFALAYEVVMTPLMPCSDSLSIARTQEVQVRFYMQSPNSPRMFRRCPMSDQTNGKIRSVMWSYGILFAYRTAEFGEGRSWLGIR